MATPKAEEAHISRLETGFRYEEKITLLEDALENATERSKKTNKKICIAKYDDGSGYVVNSHGVEKIGERIIAVLQKGEVLLIKT